MTITVAHAKNFCLEKTHSQVRIGIALGYIDQSPTDRVIDGLLFSRLITTLTQHCSTEEKVLCGFTQQINSPLLLLKNNFQITLVSSAFSSSNQYNNQMEAQVNKSTASEDQFHKMIISDDIVLYLGHSRKGGGPDFKTPHLLEDGHVDYVFYQKETPGLIKLLEILPRSHVQLLGFYSCDSEKNFSEILKESEPEINYIFTKKPTTPTEALNKIFSDLGKILSFRCVTTV